MDRRVFSKALAAFLGGAGVLCSRVRAAGAVLLPLRQSTLDGQALHPMPSTGPAGVPDLGLNANLNGMRVFSNSEWYRDVSALPNHPHGATYLATLGKQIYSEEAGGWTYSGRVVGIPYFVVDSGTQPFVPVVASNYLDECEIVYAPLPLRDDIIEGYPGNATFPAAPSSDTDRHVVVIDRKQRVCYELYQAYRRNDHWYCSNMAVWDLDGGDLQRPFNDTSADVAGQSLMAGLILGHEVTNNSIDHAFRFTIQHQCPNYFSPPATHGSAYGNSNALPFGARLRLKASVSESSRPNGGGWNPAALRIVHALKKYGMINADTGLALSPQGDTYLWDCAADAGSGPGPAWHDLRQLTSSDFEVVDTGATQHVYGGATPSGVAPTASLAVSANEVRLGQSVTLTPSWTGKAAAWITPVGNVLKAPRQVTDSPARDAWYQLEVINPYGRARQVKRVIVTNGPRRYPRFDRYIGPGGSVSNDALTPGSPWPISILNDRGHRHLIAGYVIGLLDGTYDVSTMTSPDYDYPLIEIPTGAFGKATVLQAVNSRRAELFGGANSRAILGTRYQRLSQVQIIGVKFSTPSADFAMYFSGDGAFLVDDCEFSGFKTAAIRTTGVAAPLVRGNAAHNTNGSFLVRLHASSDVHLRGNVLDVSGRIWDDYGGGNLGIVVD